MKKVIVTSFDEKYMDYSRVAIKSIGINYHSDEVLDVVCLVPENLLDSVDAYRSSVSQPNLNIRFKTANKFIKLVEDGMGYAVRHLSVSSFHRIFVGSALEDYDMAIYIDPDTIALRDIEPMLSYKSRSPFLAVVETVNMGKIVFDSDDIPYFNNGVFIADLNWWRNDGIEDRLLDWISTTGYSELAEQDAMNAVLRDYLAPLPFSFNFFEWIIDNNKLMAEEHSNPMIVHFVGDQKPWGPIAMSKYALLWRNLYSEITNA
jgi:lipopolysaccharide biosynthesis glycosyltransferase